MAVEHADIPDGERHEPKGADTATQGTAYLSDGGGSGTWSFPEVAFTALFSAVTTADSRFVAAPFAGTIEKIYGTISEAVASADLGVTFEIAGVEITDSALTFPSAGSADGDVISSTPSATNAVTAGQAIEVISDGLGTGGGDLLVTFVMQRTA